MKRKLYFTQSSVHLMLFYTSALLFVPICMAFAYIVNLEKYIYSNTIVLYFSILNAIYLVIGLLFYNLRKPLIRKKVKSIYGNEYILFVFMLVVSILGAVSLYIILTPYDSLSGYIFVPIGVLTYLIIVNAGEYIFHVNIFK